MALQDYIPENDGAFCALLAHVVQNLPALYSTLAITGATTQVAALSTDATAFAHLCGRQTTLSQAGQGATRERNRIRYGDPENPNTPSSVGYPAAPGTIPGPILPGLEKRFRDFVKWLRELPAYEDAMGVTLHLVGPQSTAPDPATLQPALKLQLNGGKVEILWGCGPAAGVAKALYLEVDRGPGAQFLAADTNPNYTDSFPLPATSQKWKYRAIWQRDGEMFGQWSSWGEINVG